MDDTISRQATIDAIDKRFDNVPMEQTAEILKLRKDLRELPSAQPNVPDTNVGDMISRQAAIDVLRTCYDTEAITYTNGKEYIDYDQALDLMENLPSAQPEITEDDVKEYCRKRCWIVVTSDLYDEMMKRWSQPERKKGKWIKITNVNHTYACSVCGRLLVNITDGENKVTKYYPFCHCGADMREGEKE